MSRGTPIQFYSKDTIWQDPSLMFHQRRQCTISSIKTYKRKRRVDGCHCFIGNNFFIICVTICRISWSEMTMKLYNYCPIFDFPLFVSTILQQVLQQNQIDPMYTQLQIQQLCQEKLKHHTPHNSRQCFNGLTRKSFEGS